MALHFEREEYAARLDRLTASLDSYQTRYGKV